MASTARLERLCKLVQADLDALPGQVVKPIMSDSNTSGGVPLTPIAESIDKQTPADVAQPQTKHPTKISPSQEPNTDRRFVWVKDAESSYNPASTPKTALTAPPPASTASLPATNLNRGDLASATQHYTPISALARYPYKWCDRAHSQDIASAFFDQGKFWAREWDLYYVWDIDNLAKPLLLVREDRVQLLLREINDHLNLSLRITAQQREDALVSRFPDHPRCTPRYLGRCKSREEFDIMMESIPDHEFRPVGEAEGPPLDERSLEAFKKLVEESFEAQRAKSKAMKAKKQQDRLLKQKSMADQSKRAQRYLGLHPTATAGTTAMSGPSPAIDPSVVFICVDVESYERAHHKITEVGVATLDTRELIGIPPGQDGKDWRNLIRARHFRIREHAHLVNSQFVDGCPERFDFGKSTFVSLAEAPEHVAACFSPPFGAHHTNGVDNMIDLMKGVDLNEKRNIVFLGHDTQGDIKYLQDLGYDPSKVENLLEALDTATLYRFWRREQNTSSLRKILYSFDITGYNLHNAGNDAMFTMQAMLGICVREASLRGSQELDNMRATEKSARLAVAVEEAQQKANDEAEGWSDHEDGDGGVPVPLSVSTSMPVSAYTPSHKTHNSNDRGAFRGRGRGRGGPQSALHVPYDSPDDHGNSSGRGRGRPDRKKSGGSRIHPRGGYSKGGSDTSDRHANMPSRGQRGSYRGRGGHSNTETAASESQVRSINLR